jgi:hypothetical protein
MEHGDHREVFDDHSEHPHGFDTTEPKGGFIAIFGVATVVTLLATILGIQYYFDQAFEHQTYTEVLAADSEQLKNLHTTEDTQLYSYQYVDRAQGTVRLTIDRAMDLLAKEAAENRLPYPTKPYAVKTPEQLAAGPGAAAAPPAAVKPGATNATPPPPVK